MKTKILPYGRRTALLQMLAMHGPLSVRSLQKIIYPPMDRRRLYESLARLYGRGLITKHCDGVLGNLLSFYQISREPSQVNKISSLLRVTAESLDRPYPRHQELLHWEECAVWTEYLKILFPDFKVYREHEFHVEPLIKKILMTDHDENEFKPDLMLLSRSNEHGELVKIAVEVERKRKSQVRLYRKLKKYCTETFLDGVVYVTESDEIMHHLQLIYEKKLLEQTSRVSHYGKTFLLFSTPMLRARGTPHLCLNADLKHLSLQEWMQNLLTNVEWSRRDENFKLQQEGAGAFAFGSEQDENKKVITV